MLAHLNIGRIMVLAENSIMRNMRASGRRPQVSYHALSIRATTRRAVCIVL